MDVVVGPHQQVDLGCLQQYIHEEDLAPLLERVTRHCHRRETYVVTYRVRHHRGGYVWLRSAGDPTADGGYRGVTRLAERDRPARAASTMCRIVNLAQSAARVCRCLMLG